MSDSFDPTSADSIVISSAPKEVLNSNIDKLNAIRHEDFVEIADNTVSSIAKMILPLCGKNALYDLVVYQQMAGDYNTNVFSNDGIHILQSLEFMSPIQTYICNYIKYIADRVEKASADGTSTAILLSCTLLSSVLREGQEIRSMEDLNDANVVAMLCRSAETLSKSLKQVREDLEDCKIDLSKVTEDIRSRLIYQLAYTTSKGMGDLAEYMVEIYKDLPEELYSFSVYTKEIVETDTRFRIKHFDYDLGLSVLPSTATIYNANLYTEVERKSPKVLILPEGIDDINLLLDYLANLIGREDTTHVFVVTKELLPKDEIAILNQFDPKSITLCQHTNYNKCLLNNPIELMAALASSGKEYTQLKSIEDLDSILLSPDSVKIIDGNNLQMFGLYEATDSYIHPLYKGDSPYYNQLVHELSTKINELRGSHSSNTTSDLKTFMTIFKLLVCPKLPVLVIGGSTIEILANTNVVNDVSGVVSTALRHGVVIDLLPKLQNIFKVIPSMRDYVTKLVEYFYELDSPEHDISLPAKAFTFIDTHYELPVLAEDDAEFNSFLITGSTFSVVQSYKAIDETIKRLHETIPKMYKIDRVIVPHSVMDK